MKVKNIQQAWNEADNLIPNDYMKDCEASERAGYSIYRSTVEYYDYICDLGDRLEVNFASADTICSLISLPSAWYKNSKIIFIRGCRTPNSCTTAKINVKQGTKATRVE